MKKHAKKLENLRSKPFDLDYKLGLIIATVIFIVTTAVFFNTQLVGDKFFWEDFLEYVYPVQTFAAKESAQGKIPFWCPYVFNGMPFVADLQVGFFYPLHRILNFAIDSNGNLSVGALQFIIILHFFIAQLTMFLLLRHYRFTFYGALIGAVSYSFSMIMICHVIHPMMIYHYTWFPLIYTMFKISFDNSDTRYGVAAGGILGLVMLSGHPQTSLYLALLLGFYFIYRITIHIKSKTKINYLSIVSPLLTFIFAAAIFQIQFLMSNELADMSYRAEMTYEESTESSLAFEQVFQFLVPDLFGKVTGLGQNETPFYLKSSSPQDLPYYYYWETAFYFGIGAFILGLFALAFHLKSRDVAFMLIISLFGILFSLGSSGVIHQIFYNLPFFGQFRNPARMMFYVVFAFSFLSAVGFDKLFYDVSKGKIKSLLIVAAIPTLILLLGLSGILTSIFDLPASYTALASSNSFFGLLIVAVIILLAFVSNKTQNIMKVGGAVVVVLVFIDLFNVGSKFNQSTVNPADAYKLDDATLNIFRANPPDNIFRVNTRSYNPPLMSMKRNQGYVDNIMTTEGYNPLALKRVNPAVTNHDLIYDLLNVKYRLILDPQSQRPVFVENPNMFPRFWYVYDWIVVNENEVENYMKNNDIDYRKTVVLEEKPNINKIDLSAHKSIKIKCREYTSNYQRYEIVNPETDFMLVLSEIWYPSWQVFIDGIPSKLYRANYSLRAVAIPQGASKIEFRFASKAFALGQWITLVALIISIPMMIYRFGGKKNGQ